MLTSELADKAGHTAAGTDLSTLQGSYRASIRRAESTLGGLAPLTDGETAACVGQWQLAATQQAGQHKKREQELTH